MKATDRAALRYNAKRAASMASRETLLSILGRYKSDGTITLEAIVASRDELVNRYACDDCGAVAGRECKPGYGCLDSSRCRVAGVRSLR